MQQRLQLFLSIISCKTPLNSARDRNYRLEAQSSDGEDDESAQHRSN